MQISRKIAAFLVVVAAFMIFEWINLGFNLAPGHPKAFYVVHGILIAVNLVLAIVLGVIGLRGLGKRPKRPLM
ncbi:SCO4848 family membrane protein [Streptosporangium sp. NPDC000396]|uniref:SCO4848 family membrane protein n=1 Tax=Streptosporangium sp. NPDC000396 TaxID=3366185 RepID=UPI0036C95DE6